MSESASLPSPISDTGRIPPPAMSYSDPQPPLPTPCTNIAPPPPLAPNNYPWPFLYTPPPIPDLETLDPPPLPPFPPHPPLLHDPYYTWGFLPPPPPSISEEAWYTRATPFVLFLILLVALISGLTTLVCKCFFRRWRSQPNHSNTDATNGSNFSFDYEI